MTARISSVTASIRLDTAAIGMAPPCGRRLSPRSNTPPDPDIIICRPPSRRKVLAAFPTPGRGLDPARNATVEISGPEQFGLDEIARVHLTANEDTRRCYGR